LEKNEGKMKLEVLGETHTFMNIITEYAWEAGAKQASYIIQHPYMSEPHLIVSAKNPKKTLSDASQIISEKATEFQKSFKRATKK